MSFRLPSEGSVLKKDWARRTNQIDRSHINLRNERSVKIYPAGRRCKNVECRALLRRTNPDRECQRCQLMEARQSAIIKAAVQMAKEAKMVKVS